MQRSDFNIPKRFYLLLTPFIVLFLLTLYSCKPEDFIPQGSENSGGNAQGSYESGSRGGEESGESNEGADTRSENEGSQSENAEHSDEHQSREEGGEPSETDKDRSDEEGKSENRESTEDDQGDGERWSYDNESGEDNKEDSEESYERAESGEDGEYKKTSMCIHYSYPEEAEKKEAKRERNRDKFENLDEFIDKFDNTQRVQIEDDLWKEDDFSSPTPHCDPSSDLYDIIGNVKAYNEDYDIYFVEDSGIEMTYFSNETWTGVKFDGYISHFPEYSVKIVKFDKNKELYKNICGTKEASLKVKFGYEFPDGEQLEQGVVNEDLFSPLDCEGVVEFNKEAISDGYEQAYKVKIEDAKYLLTIFEIYADNKLVVKAVLKFKKPALSTK